MSDLHSLLIAAARRKSLPTVLAYNRIDGPGSSLDLREFQQSFWSLPSIPNDLTADQAMEWTRMLPRTVGITINIGTQIYAEPFNPELIAVQSIEYGTEVFAKPGEVLPTKQNWLLKTLELFGLRGVKFVLHNLRPGIQSSGLGGSASATTGVCILANELAGRPFTSLQLVSMASRLEQDYGVSITGTQEQSNVIFGGVCDYVWFPWGIPKIDNTGYGTSIRSELVPHERYEELEKRFAIFHSGITRASTDVNSIWVNALYQQEGYRLHKLKLDIAYRFREGLRLNHWNDVRETIKDYQEVRSLLCPAYMDGAKELQGFAREAECVVFPLGAGGGGGILVFGHDPESLAVLRQELRGVYREIPFKIQPHGHEIKNLPLQEER
ncbi:MAG: GHMP kinase [Desulfomonilia bacterium]|jgi:D-glycero-alpha-D-manno-heptose-7-phosphate kinase